MITETREIYRCEFCKKLYLRKSFAEKHEKICSKNPNNHRACLNFCEHFTKKNVVHYFDTYFGEDKRELNLFYCDKFKKYLYPPKVEIKMNYFDLGDEYNDPMPKSCDSYKCSF